MNAPLSRPSMSGVRQPLSQSRPARRRCRAEAWRLACVQLGVGEAEGLHEPGEGIADAGLAGFVAEVAGEDAVFDDAGDAGGDLLDAADSSCGRNWCP